MKKLSLICLAAIAAVSAGAQTAQNQDQQTTLHVNVAVERQDIVAGPYARYAQKYLGTAAPLADKVLYEITSVNMPETSDMPAPKNMSYSVSPSHMNPAVGFPKLTVDKTSAAAMSLEESARLAAEKIFEIRRSRFDLITGDVGENVFGGGLDSALKELGRLEEEYLSLFLGRQTTRTDTKQYSVTPTKGKFSYIVCRFSDTSGLLPADDLSGEPMVLELQFADGRSSSETSGVQSRPSARSVPQTIPADMRCRIILGGVELASEQFRIRQLGETVYVAQ